MVSSTETLVDKIEEMITDGEYQQTLELIGDNQELPLLMQKAVIFEKIGRYQESLDLALSIHKETEQKSYLYFKSLVTIAYGYWRMGEFDNVNKTLFNTLDDIDSLDKNEKSEKIYQLEAECYYVFGIIHEHNDELKKSTSAFEKAMEIRKKYGNSQVPYPVYLWLNKY